jgi:hypothetical protein
MTKLMRPQADTNLVPHVFQVPLEVANGQSCVILRAENQTASWVIRVPGITKEMLTEFRAKGYDPFLVSFPHDLKGEFVEVKIRFKKVQHLGSPKSGVQNDQGNDVSADLVPALGPEIYHDADSVW